MEFTTNPQPAQDEIQAAMDAVKNYSLLQRYYEQIKPKDNAACWYDTTPFPSVLDEPPADSIDRMLFDKRFLLGEQIGSLSCQVQKRTELYKENMEFIGSQDCGISSKILILDTAFPNRPLDMVVARRRQGLEQELHQLHVERRSERLGLWDDLRTLYKEIQEVADDYGTAKRNEELVRGDEIEGN